MKYKNLSDVCEIVGGGTPSKRREDYYGGDILWTTVGDMQGDFVGETKLKITKLGLENSSTNVIPVNNVIIATRVGLGKVCILKKDAAINQDLKGIIPKESNSISNIFLFYWFKSISKKIIEAGTGATVQGVRLSFVKHLQIPIPPLPEQKQIVALLDQAFAAIDRAKANIERNIENTQELFQSKLNAIFSQRGEGWEEEKLGDICENLDSRRVPITKSKRIAGDIPYYGASGIVDYVKDYLFDEDLLLVSEDGANLLARTYPIAFSISGKNWVNNHAHVLRFENMTNQIFVEFYLNSIKLDNYVSGMAQPKLNQRMLKSILVPFPQKEIQDEIVTQIRNLKTHKSNIQNQYHKKLNSLEELKNSILQKAFSGELTKQPAMIDEK